MINKCCSCGHDNGRYNGSGFMCLNCGAGNQVDEIVAKNDREEKKQRRLEAILLSSQLYNDWRKYERRYTGNPNYVVWAKALNEELERDIYANKGWSMGKTNYRLTG